MAKNTSRFILERLHDWGVRRIFAYPGDGINSFLGAFNEIQGTEHEIEFTQTRHEEIAAFGERAREVYRRCGSVHGHFGRRRQSPPKRPLRCEPRPRLSLVGRVASSYEPPRRRSTSIVAGCLPVCGPEKARA